MPSNVKDHDTWERAKKEAGDGADYALVNHIYQKMGGTFTSGEVSKARIPDALMQRFHMRRNIAGQIPRKTLPPSLTAMPGPKTPGRMLEHDGPMLRPQAITRNLGMAPAAEANFQRFVKTLQNSDNEAVLRGQLFQFMHYEGGYDPALRSALAQRTLNYYKTTGRSQANDLRVERRVQGLRKARDQVEDVGLPEPWGVLIAKPNPDGSRKKCLNCIMWDREDSACVIHKRDLHVGPDHICGYHVYGKPLDGWMDHPGIDPVDPNMSGLELVPEGTACDNCAAFVRAGTAGGNCIAIKGEPDVKNRTCCARWTEKDTMSKSSERLVILEKGGEGSRGGNVVGHTASGKPIYEHHDMGQHHAQQATNLSLRSQGLKGKAKKEHHAQMAAHHANAAESYMRAHKESGDDKHRDAASFQLRSAQLHSKKAGLSKSELEKAQARGGSYHRRVKGQNGKFRYFYDEDKYNSRDDAHISGADAKKGNCKGAVDKRLSGKGVKVAALKNLLEQYDADMIAQVVRDGVTSGRYEHVNGVVRMAADKVQKGGEGSRGGVVIGRTKSGKPIYMHKDHPDHKGYTKKDHRTAATEHEMKARAKQFASPGHEDIDQHEEMGKWHREQEQHAPVRAPKLQKGDEDAGGKERFHMQAAADADRAPASFGPGEGNEGTPSDDERRTNEDAAETERVKRLKKGGEGSRGGNIIGHTKSGKPIYASQSTKKTKGWHAQDHRDAAAKHKAEAKRKMTEEDSPGGHRHHRSAADDHESAAATLANYHGEGKAWPADLEKAERFIMSR